MDTEVKRTPLITKYDIPIAHLDFGYIKTCNNAREMEKIVHILRSNEEGYFPDLTKCAEDKLKELKPNSKQFRSEQNILTKDTLEKGEWEKENAPIIQWTNDIKIKDKLLLKIDDSADDLSDIRPPIRHEMKKINSNSKPTFNDKEIKSNKIEEISKPKSIERIKSSEYDKWDKYDAETEILKMDLEQERIKEEVERKNTENLKRQKEMNRKIEIPNEDVTYLDKLTEIEKDSLSIMHKDRGNDYYKSKEYEIAVFEYTKSLSYMKTAAGYNNRAIAYLKLMKYNYCINDCNKCLEIDPSNIKALLRKAQAFLEMDQRRSAHDVFLEVLSIDSSNKMAYNAINSLKKQLPDLPPASATRLIIEEDSHDTYNEYKKEINTITEISDDDPLISIAKVNAHPAQINNPEQASKPNLNKESQIALQQKNSKSTTECIVNLEQKTPINTARQLKSDKQTTSSKSLIKTQIDDQLKLAESQKSYQKVQKIKTDKNNEDLSKKSNKNKKDVVQDDNYGLEDLATLIMPKKIKKSKVALALEAMKKPALNPLKNSGVAKKNNNLTDSNKNDELKFFSDNQGLKNLKFIQEMK